MSELLQLGILQQQANLALWRNLVGYWKLDDNAATDTVIDSCNANNGRLSRYDASTFTYRNTDTASVSGKIGRGMTFQTSGVYDQRVGIGVPNSTNYSCGNGTADTPFAIGCWIYLNGWGALTGGVYNSYFAAKRIIITGSFEWVFYSRYNTSTSVYDLAWVLRNKATDSDANYILAFGNVTSGYTGAWHYVLATYDGSSTKEGLNIYSDGVDITSSRGSSGAYDFSNNKNVPLTIGNLDGGVSRSFAVDGIVDEVAIWKGRLLTPTDALSLYSYGAGRPYYK